MDIEWAITTLAEHEDSDYGSIEEASDYDDDEEEEDDDEEEEEEIPQCVFESGHSWMPIGEMARECRICGHEVDER